MNSLLMSRDKMTWEILKKGTLGCLTRDMQDTIPQTSSVSNPGVEAMANCQLDSTDYGAHVVMMVNHLDICRIADSRV
jgi:hypothetical protein